MIARDQPVIFAEILGLRATLNQEERQIRIANAVEIESWAQEAGYELLYLKPGGGSVAVHDIRSHLPEASGNNYLLRTLAR